MDLEAEKVKRDQRLKTKRERIGVPPSAASEVVTPVAPSEHISAEKERKPKEKMRRAKGASAKRKLDESASEQSTGTQ